MKSFCTLSFRKALLSIIGFSICLYAVLYLVLNLPPSLFIPRAPTAIQQYSSVPMSLRVLHDGKNTLATRVLWNAWAASQQVSIGLRPMMFIIGLTYYPYRLSTMTANTIMISDGSQTYSLITLQTQHILDHYHLPIIDWDPDLTQKKHSTDLAHLTLDHVLLHEIGHTLSLRYTQYQPEETTQVEGFADIFSLWVLAQQGAIHLRHPLIKQLIHYRMYSSSPLYSIDSILNLQLRWVQDPTALFSAQLQSTPIKILDALWVIAEPAQS